MTTTITVGDVTIHRIVEIETGSTKALESMPLLTPARLAENREWLYPTALDPEDRMLLCFQSYIVRTRRHVVLVDSCIGNEKTRDTAIFHQKTDESWMSGLAEWGLTVSDIDFVMCTHLHVDHVGWNTRLESGRWVPTFPKARYLFSRKELDYWMAEHAREPISCIEDSVIPIVEAKLCDLIASDHVVDDYLRLLPTPGHTIDHFAVALGRAGEDAVITGDLIHSPLQARYPELSMRIDYDPEQSAETRQNFLERYCDTSTICCFAHFPSPSWGHIKRWDTGFRVEYDVTTG